MDAAALALRFSELVLRRVPPLPPPPPGSGSEQEEDDVRLHEYLASLAPLMPQPQPQPHLQQAAGGSGAAEAVPALVSRATAAAAAAAAGAGAGASGGAAGVRALRGFRQAVLNALDDDTRLALFENGPAQVRACAFTLRCCSKRC